MYVEEIRKNGQQKKKTEFLVHFNSEERSDDCWALFGSVRLSLHILLLLPPILHIYMNAQLKCTITCSPNRFLHAKPMIKWNLKREKKKMMCIKKVLDYLTREMRDHQVLRLSNKWNFLGIVFQREHRAVVFLLWMNYSFGCLFVFFLLFHQIRDRISLVAHFFLKRFNFLLIN